MGGTKKSKIRGDEMVISKALVEKIRAMGVVEKIFYSVMALLLVLLIVLICCCWTTPHRVVGTEAYDAFVLSVYYKESSPASRGAGCDIVKLYFGNPSSGSRSSDGGLWVMNETGMSIQAGHSYHFVFRVESNGWGPIYYLEQATKLE